MCTKNVTVNSAACMYLCGGKMQKRMTLKKKKQLFLFIHRPEVESVSDVDCTLITNLETLISIDTQLVYYCKCTKN